MRCIDVERDRWHSLECLESAVLFECKDGGYRALMDDEIMGYEVFEGDLGVEFVECQRDSEKSKYTSLYSRCFIVWFALAALAILKTRKLE